MANLDCLLTPTAGRHFTIEEMLAEPIEHNSDLGYYTNFMNLLDFSAIAVPTIMTENNLPFGVTLIAPEFSDRMLLSIANRIQQNLPLQKGALDITATPSTTSAVDDKRFIDVMVCGATSLDSH